MLDPSSASNQNGLTISVPEWLTRFLEFMSPVYDWMPGFWAWATSANSSSGAILISAISAGLFAAVAIRQNRVNSRETTTVQIVNQTAWDKDFIDARQQFRRLRSDQDLLVSAAADLDGSDAQIIFKMLNHYELISIGVNTGILSGKIYASYYKTRFVLDWFACKLFVIRLREKNASKYGKKHQDLYVEYEKLAEKWAVKYGIASELNG